MIWRVAMDSKFREEIVDIAFSIAAIATLRGKCTVDRNEKGYQKFNWNIDEKIKDLIRLFINAKRDQETNKGVPKKT